jgi:CYTH domain-containing protein
MATEIEFEKTYLLKALPDGIEQADSVLIRDVYIPQTADHAHLRLRQKNDKYVITKKCPVNGLGGDPTHSYEHTIELIPEEFEALASRSNKDFIKRRYFMKLAGRSVEIDVYGEKLAGLAVVDFEFDSKSEMDAFEMPDCALADVSNEEATAGGYLAGKSIEEIMPQLEKYGYKKLEINL